MNTKQNRQAGNLAAAGRNAGALASAVNHTANLKKIKLPNGRTVGQVRGDVFRRTVHSSKHLLHKWPGPGWALACSVLEDAQHAGAVYVELFDADTGSTYWALLADFFTLGAEIHFPGFEPQRLLNLKHWQTSTAKATAQHGEEQEAGGAASDAGPVEAVAQMPLFGGLAL